MESILVTGGTGLVGLGVIEKLLALDPSIRITVPVRSSSSATLLAARLGAGVKRLHIVGGDITRRRLGIDAHTLRTTGDLDAVIHCAADTTFSNPPETARAVNTAGTAHVLELAAELNATRIVHVSTAYTAGRRTGRIAELPHDGIAGFVNGYEQSKHEAEQLVARSGLPFVIVRPSSIVCDDVSATVTQLNAVHRALRVFHAGLASMMPGAEDTPLDLVTNEHVVQVIVRALYDASAGTCVHACAGDGAMPLGHALDRAQAVWSRDTEWRRRGITRPALTDMETYRLFETSVEETGDARLAMITRSLSHFVPQLALPKHFETARGDALAGGPAPRVADLWDNLLLHLERTRWGASRSAA